ncbi:MAG: gamma-glutamyltransferase, partial [Pseudomonadota bacterium]
VLARGGNAVDAAVATAFALAAAEPWMSGLGGIGFMVVQAAGAAPSVVDFGPLAPRRLDPAAFALSGRPADDLFPWPGVEGERNAHGPWSIAVPGAVDGYGLALERFGTMSLAEAIAPAIPLAERGLPVDWVTTLRVANGAAELAHYPTAREIWLPNGLPPVGPADGRASYLKLGRLAATLKRLAAAGRRDFYEGGLAGAIAADLAALGGVLDAADLAAYRARVVPALAIDYRGTSFAAAPGLTAAPTLARVLGLIEPTRFGAAPDAAAFVAYAEALRQAYAERLDGLGDAGAFAAEACTTHLNVVDRHGTLVALTSTLLSVFGSRVVLPSTGILMNNGIYWFDPRPGRANSIAPGKRPLTNMCPAIAARGGKPWFAVGASGGRKILAAVVQIASFVADFGLDVEAAAAHPRIDVSGPDGASVDRRMPEAIVAALAARMPTAAIDTLVAPILFANPSIAVAGSDGVNSAAADLMSPWSAAVAEPGSAAS